MGQLSAMSANHVDPRSGLTDDHVDLAHGREVCDDGKALTARRGEGDISHLKTRLENGKTVTLGIRPEHLDEKQGVALSLSVDVSERLGLTSYVHGALRGETVVAERREDQPRFGETITLRFQPTRARVFDREGSRIR
ncbi:TOBE domain-containing protein [Mesorhizobium sp. M1A.F.Ca.ET.072.01.1.1]|uniref:TOBE domain-containing protein n=1 Tax=Mesorhizobium sp. M1A.F.Ca.ET.072.01.1.1 TaxID=2496753 RepID=UPI001FE0615C|nr:TOBE domain-containing protein [Mesorhizobium sp. M1A.F.Ca.ET.072.01.1.1]